MSLNHVMLMNVSSQLPVTFTSLHTNQQQRHNKLIWGVSLLNGPFLQPKLISTLGVHQEPVGFISYCHGQPQHQQQLLFESQYS